MDDQKKRIAFYSVLIIICFTGAYFFLKMKATPLENIPAQAPPEQDSLVAVVLLSDVFDLENSGDGFETTEKAATGKRSCKLSPDFEFGVNNIKIVKDIPGFASLKKIELKFKSFFEKIDPAAVYVVSINDDKGKNIFWDSRPIVYSETTGWSEQSMSFTIPPEFLNPENRISVYPWNKNKKTFYVDDVTMDFIGMMAYEEGATNASEKSNTFYDFETEASLSTADYVKETTAHSGKKACELTGGQEFGPMVNKKLSDLGASFPKTISASVWVYPLSDNVNILLTVSVVTSKKETIFWEGEGSENKSFPKFKWTKINLLWKLPVEKFAPEDVLGVGVWNKGHTDVIVDDLEIIYGDSPERRGEPSKVDPVSIYEKRFVPEKNKPPFRTIWLEKQESGKELDAFSPGDVFIAANFNNDAKGIDEILCVGKTKTALFTYDESTKQFKKIWENKSSADELWNSDNSYGGTVRNGKTSLIVRKKTKSLSECLLFDGKNWILGEEKTSITLPSQPASAVSSYFGRFTSESPQVLKLDKSWRFDLKLIENDLILGTVDFKGYPADQNPKYYEYVTLLKGHFTSSKRDAILVFMANCADSNFDGSKCNVLESLPYLPNATQLYSFPG